MALFPYEAWLTECVDKINASKEYQEAAATWEGDLLVELKGDVFTMIRHVKAAKAFVAVTGTVQTEFIDEQS